VHEYFGLPEFALTLLDLAAEFGEGPPIDASGAVRFLEGKSFLCLLEPPALDARIAAQASVLTLCSDVSTSLDGFLEEHGLSDAFARYVIPQARVAYVRDQVDVLGIDERRVFPDRDGVAAAIRRYYH
jgi:hypothetical protein